MRRYNIDSRILLILTVITFALAAPTLVQVQDKRQACVDVVHVPEDVTTVLKKRMDEQELQNLWNDFGERIYQNLWRNPIPGGIHLPAPPEVHVPPPDPAVHVPPHNPADSDHESMDLEDGAPPTSPKSSTESEDWHSPPTSPKSSTESEDWYTAASSLGSSTESDSESESDRWPTISNAPSAEPLSENLNAADSEMRGKAKVSRRISGTDVQVDTVNVARLELLTPGHSPKTEETGSHGSANPSDF